MTSKKRLSSEERKKQIMSAAAELFAEKGFSGTRTREIASLAGISETLIFQHFKSKEELYRSILLENLAHHPLQPEIEQYLHVNDDRAVFYKTAVHLLKNMNDSLIVRLYLFGILENPQLVNIFPRRDDPGVMKLLGDYIQKRIEDGAFKQINPYSAAQGFVMSVTMFCLEQVLAGKEQTNSADVFIEALVSIFLGGLTS